MSICDSDFIQMLWKFDWNERKLETLIFSSNRWHHFWAVTISFVIKYHFQWNFNSCDRCHLHQQQKKKSHSQIKISKQSDISSAKVLGFQFRFAWLVVWTSLWMSGSLANAGVQSDVKWALISLELKSLQKHFSQAIDSHYCPFSVVPIFFLLIFFFLPLSIQLIVKMFTFPRRRTWLNCHSI